MAPGTSRSRHGRDRLGPKMATMGDLDRIALEIPEATGDVSADGCPAYLNEHGAPGG